MASSGRKVELDSIAVLIVGIVLVVMLALSMALTLVNLDNRQDEHLRIERKVEQMIRAENHERRVIENVGSHAP